MSGIFVHHHSVSQSIAQFDKSLSILKVFGACETVMTPKTSDRTLSSCSPLAASLGKGHSVFCRDDHPMLKSFAQAGEQPRTTRPAFVDTSTIRWHGGPLLPRHQRQQGNHSKWFASRRIFRLIISDCEISTTASSRRSLDVSAKPQVY